MGKRSLNREVEKRRKKRREIEKEGEEKRL